MRRLIPSASNQKIQPKEQDHLLLLLSTTAEQRIIRFLINMIQRASPREDDRIDLPMARTPTKGRAIGGALVKPHSDRCSLRLVPDGPPAESGAVAAWRPLDRCPITQSVPSREARVYDAWADRGLSFFHSGSTAPV